MAGYPLKDDELEGIRRRLADVLSCDDAVRLLGHVDYLRNELTKIQKRQMQAWEDARAPRRTEGDMTMADEQLQAVGDQMPRLRVVLQQAVARYILRTGHPAWVLMPEHFKGGPRISLRFIEETRPDFGEQVLVGHGADEETAARDLIAKLSSNTTISPVSPTK